METSRCIKTRRSIRKFRNKKIEKKDIITALEAAQWAPSAGNVQDKEYIIVTDKEKINKISEACQDQQWMKYSQAVIVFISRPERISLRYGDRANYYALLSGGAAIQNFMLSLHDQGIGSTLTGLFDDSMLKKSLKIPESRLILGVVSAGYPAEVPPAPKRISLEFSTFFNEYKKKRTKELPKKIWMHP